jgi:hypothetical protein
VGDLSRPLSENCVIAVAAMEVASATSIWPGSGERERAGQRPTELLLDGDARFREFDLRVGDVGVAD